VSISLDSINKTRHKPKWVARSSAVMWQHRCLHFKSRFANILPFPRHVSEFLVNQFVIFVLSLVLPASRDHPG
jgi:hypothetical protein